MALKYVFGVRRRAQVWNIPLTASIVYAPALIDGEVVGIKRNPLNFVQTVFIGTYTSRIEASKFADSSSVTIGIAKQSSDFNIGVGERLFNLLVEIDTESALYSQILTSGAYVYDPDAISGRFRFNPIITALYTMTYGAGTNLYISGDNVVVRCSIDFTLNGVQYVGFGFRYDISSASTGDKTATAFELITDTEITEYTLAEMSTFSNSLIDFGETPQNIPPFFKSWLETQTEPIYPYSYTVKNYAGDVVLSSIIEAPSMVNADLVIVGNLRTLTLTGSNGQDYVLSWTSETPEKKQFRGLSNSPKSNRVVLPADTSMQVSWEGNLVFYEAYGTYRPPETTFDINLYQNSAEVNRVDKGSYLVGVGTLSGALRDECSILTPSIVYQSSDVPTFNYVYIPIFNRYYFVTSLSSVSKNVWRMELNCDVLMTYKNEILLLQGVVGRQEFDFNPMLVDSEIPTQDNPEVEIINIPSTAFLSHTNITGNLYNFVLTVIG